MTAVAMSVHNADGKLSCSICQSRFADMTLSSCFHTFCPKCLLVNTGHSQTGHYECPICNTPVSIPPASDPLLGEGRGYTTAREPAYSTRLGEATCDICADGTFASHQCLQCKERFCNTCTNAHMKMKASRYHSDQVIPLRDERGMGRDSYCPRHKSHRVLFFCKECNVLVCNICKLLEHENHVTKLVSEEATEVKERLSFLLRNQSGYMDNLQSRLRKVNDRRNQYPYQLEQEIEKVRQQATKMHLEIESEKTETEKELEHHYYGYISQANNSAEHLREDYDQRSSLIAEAQQLMNSSHDLQCVQDGSYICQKLQETDSDRQTINMVKTPEQPYKRFIPAVTTNRESQRLVGMVTGNRSHTLHTDSPTKSKPEALSRRHKSQPDLRDGYSDSSGSFGPSSPLPAEPIQISNISEFSLPHDDLDGYVYGIAPIAGQQLAWVTMLDHNSLMLTDKNGNIENRVDLREPCEGVTSDSDGGCYVTCPVSRSIYYVSSRGDVRSIVLGMNMVPHGMAGWQYFDTKRRTMIEELYLCFTDPAERHLYEIPRGYIGVFSFFGQDLGKALSVRSPVRIDVDLATRMLCISDHENGCVTICDRAGRRTTGLYTGEEDGGDFKPLGVCFDHTGHVIVADWAGKKVSRISQNGDLIQHLLSGEFGPQSVAMGDNGMLWVGGTKGRISVYNID